ncbi:MAG TPA: IlvD/Edd family dehydratase [Burkholderiales bacterium]|nr:IlvD/Edd family dehydratase [Burkholderiales bacterium]
MASDKARGLERNLTNYGDRDFAIYLRRSFARSMGYSKEMLERPIVGVAQSGSGFNNCHRTMPELIEAVKRGVMLAGGLPVEFPTITLHESFAHPTSMYLRNLMAIDTEEMIRAQPIDSTVLIGGCDKTVPALLMGAASANVPAILMVTGPMLTGTHKGERLGACTDCRRFWARYRAGEIDDTEINEVNAKLAPTAGTCMVMGTASTMALCSEALGMMLPGGAAIPAVLAERVRNAEATGARAVALAKERLTPDRIMTPEAFENALRVLLAVGGSTNAIVHFAAVAGRLGFALDLDGFDRMGRETPVLVDLKPTGQHYMEHLYEAGGLATILRELKPMLHGSALTINGKTLQQNIDEARVPEHQDVVRPCSNPIFGGGGIAVLRGNLAPDGAIIKQAAATPKLMTHTGRAVVFESLEDLAARIDDPQLDVNADDVIVLKNAGPVGAPGMPEAGYIPIPRKLAQQGVKDMVRISDARMSGTAFGSIVLHVTPESAIGGALALVRNGDRIRLDVPARAIELLVNEAELAARRKAWKPALAATGPERGYRKLFLDTVQQADKGCDFDFLAPEVKLRIPRTP